MFKVGDKVLNTASGDVATFKSYDNCIPDKCVYVLVLNDKTSGHGEAGTRTIMWHTPDVIPFFDNRAIPFSVREPSRYDGDEHGYVLIEFAHGVTDTINWAAAGKDQVDCKREDCVGWKHTPDWCGTSARRECNGCDYLSKASKITKSSGEEREAISYYCQKHKSHHCGFCKEDLEEFKPFYTENGTPCHLDGDNE